MSHDLDPEAEIGQLKPRVWQAALAGLLHDVGKLEQRARVDPWNPAPDVPRDGQPVHATWSVYFAEKYVPEPYRAVARLGAFHHAPQNSPTPDKHLSELVALADKLSAGERTDLDKNTSKAPPQQMVTIFDRVSMMGKPRADNYLPLVPLTLASQSLFPAAVQTKNVQGDAYDVLRQELEQAARQAEPEPETYLENLLAAMQRTTWCVPSAYYHSIPDVSLYDHSRMTAALAVCLSEFDESQVRERLEAVRRDFEGQSQTGDQALLDGPVALLVGGDLSGVQNFIYTLTSQGAARTLRGRSFYLQLLTEAVLRYVLRELGLPYTNVIYAGGGHFYLLAPMGAARHLPEIREYIARALLEHHGAALYVALDGAPMPASGFKLGRFPEFWNKMHLALGQAKQRRYVDLGDELYARVFEPQPHGGNRENTCAVCGQESLKTSSLDDEENPGARICALCDSFDRALGRELPHARFVALGLGAPQATEHGSALDVLRAFGMQVAFAHEASQMTRFPHKPERVVIWALDDVEEWPTVKDAPTARMVRYTVNQVTPYSFDQLQDKAHGIPRLGVLRMDVDDLGRLFQQGLGDYATLARISTLSFQMSLFFEGWVKRLCERYPDLIYAVYAGGDDVFLIGPWDRMPALGSSIAADLGRYVGGNPDVHVSGGLAFIHGKYPVYQAAEDAHEALEQAKALDGKNAFSFLGLAYKWDEFAQVTTKFERLKKLVNDPAQDGLGGPQAILQVLRQLAQDEADKAKQFKGRPVWGPWMWHGVYLLVRMAERATRNDKLKDELNAIRNELSKNDFRDIRQWGTAARWAQLWLREQQDERKG